MYKHCRWSHWITRSDRSDHRSCRSIHPISWAGSMSMWVCLGGAGDNRWRLGLESVWAGADAGQRRQRASAGPALSATPGAGAAFFLPGLSQGVCGGARHARLEGGRIFIKYSDALNPKPLSASEYSIISRGNMMVGGSPLVSLVSLVCMFP